MTLAQLNALDDAAAMQPFLRCCGSPRWAARMTAARPFDDESALLATADAVWNALDEAGWREAFAAHPRIGSGASAGEEPWPTQEQAGVATAAATVLERLAAKNREYDERFGYIFIVCATGKSADEMLAMLEARLTNDPSTEIRVAADQQRQITRLRLRKLLAEPAR